MTTATLSPPNPTKAAKPTREPADPRLQFHRNCAFDSQSQRTKFVAKCFAFEDATDDIMQRADGELIRVAEMPTRDFLAGERDALLANWKSWTTAHVASYIALRWERRAILLTLGNAHKAAVASTWAAYEKSRDDECQNLRQTGAASSMPAAHNNPEAALAQLQARADMQEWVMAAKGVWAEAVEAERVWKSQLEAIPTFQSCTIRWPEFAPGIASEIARLVGLERVTVPQRQEFSPRGQRILRDFGLESCPLLPSHVDAVKKLDGISITSMYHPLSDITAAQLPEVRRLVEQLPPTPQALKFLSDTTRGIPQYVL